MSGARSLNAALSAAFLLLAPLAAQAQAPDYRLEVAPGAKEETVVSWARERCEEWDLPDAPLVLGTVYTLNPALAGHPDGRLPGNPKPDCPK